METTCFGVWRNETFSDLLRRSRSRCRSRSRSLATAFMRLESPSPANSGMTSVYTVALAAMAASSMVMNRASWSLETTNSIMRHRQKSKLIILRITRTPIVIQDTQASSMNCPM